MRAGRILVVLVLFGASVAVVQPASNMLEFLAVSREGKAVPALTSADIELKIGGKVASVTELERIMPEDGRPSRGSRSSVVAAAVPTL